MPQRQRTLDNNGNGCNRGQNQRPDRPAGQARVTETQFAELLVAAHRHEAGLDHAAGRIEILGQRGLEGGTEMLHPRLQLQRFEAVQRQRLETRTVEAGPGAAQLAAHGGHALAVDQVLEGLGHGRAA